MEVARGVMPTVRLVQQISKGSPSSSDITPLRRLGTG